jgi:hypothetical protein
VRVSYHREAELPALKSLQKKLGARRLQPKNVQVAEAGLLPVILKGDRGGLLFPESFDRTEFAGGDSLHQIRGADFKFHDLDAVQPLLGVRAANQNARLVELTWWLGHIPRRNDQVV